jgi:hypothetical protein
MLFDYMGNSPSQDSQKSICGCCGSEVFAKTGVEKEWHWAHYSLDDCDDWAEPNGESMWHYEWKKYLREEWGAKTEVKMGRHRADAVLPGGLVIELQASRLDPKEVEKREAFYGNMIWIYKADWFDHKRVFFSQRHPEVVEYLKWSIEDRWNPFMDYKEPAFRYPFSWRGADSAQYQIRKPLYWHTESGQLLEVILAEVTMFSELLNKKIPGKYGQIVSVNNEFGRDIGKLVAA